MRCRRGRWCTMGLRQVSTVLTAPAGSADKIWSPGLRGSLVVFGGFRDLLDVDKRFLEAFDAKKRSDVDWERVDLGVLRFRRHPSSS